MWHGLSLTSADSEQFLFLSTGTISINFFTHELSSILTQQQQQQVTSNADIYNKYCGGTLVMFLFLSKLQNKYFKKCLNKHYYDNQKLTYICSDESETFFSACSYVTSTSLTHSNCPHKQFYLPLYLAAWHYLRVGTCAGLSISLSLWNKPVFLKVTKHITIQITYG